MSTGIYKRQPMLEETKRKISLSEKGKVVSKESKIKMSLSRIEFYKTHEHPRGTLGKHIWKNKQHPKGMLGKHQSEETRQKMRLNNARYFLNKPSYIRTDEIKRKNSEALKGKHLSEETKKKISKFQKELWKNEEFRKRILSRRIPSDLEQKMISIIEKLNLPYKFVGDGKFWIENKNPDFINCNGEKIALEVFCRSHKEHFKGGLENWKIERQELFNKYGWKIIFLDETQVNEKKVVEKICQT